MILYQIALYDRLTDYMYTSRDSCILWIYTHIGYIYRDLYMCTCMYIYTYLYLHPTYMCICVQNMCHRFYTSISIFHRYIYIHVHSIIYISICIFSLILSPSIGIVFGFIVLVWYVLCFVASVDFYVVVVMCFVLLLR